MTNDPLVSVVTPVFNDAQYLTECATRVLEQTYTNWDYAIIDNASTDETPDIAAKFAAADSRIRHVRFEEYVNSNENHNRAFRTIDSASDFCKVVSADDWMFTECLARMVAAAKQSDTIGLVIAYRLAGYGVSDYEVDLVGLPYWKSVAPGGEIIRQVLLDGPGILGGPSAHLFRSDLVRERQPFFHASALGCRQRGCVVRRSANPTWLRPSSTHVPARVSPESLQMAVNMATYVPEFIWFHLRYGREALDPDEYRPAAAGETEALVWSACSPVPTPVRFRTPEFFVIAPKATQMFLDEGGDDIEVRTAMNSFAACYAREMLRT